MRKSLSLAAIALISPLFIATGLPGCGKSGGESLRLSSDWAYKGTRIIDWAEATANWGAKESTKCSSPSDSAEVEITLRPNGAVTGSYSPDIQAIANFNEAGETSLPCRFESFAGVRKLEGTYQPDGTISFSVASAPGGSVILIEGKVSKNEIYSSFEESHTGSYNGGVSLTWKVKRTFKLARQK